MKILLILIAVGVGGLIAWAVEAKIQHDAELDAKRLKEVCYGTGKYHDWVQFIHVGSSIVPIYHHTEITECKVVPK